MHFLQLTLKNCVAQKVLFGIKSDGKLNKCNLAEILDCRVEILDFKTYRKSLEVLKSKICFWTENRNLKLSFIFEMNMYKNEFST